jgi:hypothetical protein
MADAVPIPCAWPGIVPALAWNVGAYPHLSQPYCARLVELYHGWDVRLYYCTVCGEWPRDWMLHCRSECPCRDPERPAGELRAEKHRAAVQTMLRIADWPKSEVWTFG